MKHFVVNDFNLLWATDTNLDGLMNGLEKGLSIRDFDLLMGIDMLKKKKSTSFYRPITGISAGIS